MSRPGGEPLRGKTIVILRADEDAASLRARLEEAGARVVCLPCIRFEPHCDPEEVRAALADLGGGVVSWIALASRNAVRYFAELLRGEGGHAASREVLSGRTRLAVIGPGTAEEAGRRLRAPDLVADRSVAEGLAESLREAARPGDGQVLVPAAKDGRKALVEGLREAGFTVRRLVVYRTVVGITIEGERPALDAGPDATDAVIFTSPSTVRGYFSGRKWSQDTAAFSIGPTTTRALEDHGVRRVHEAGPHDLEGILDALYDWAGKST